MRGFGLVEILIVLALVLLNGYFAMSELAVVSALPARLEALARKGSRGARLALALARDPGRMLSTVQIGITLVGIITGAFGGATLADALVREREALGDARDRGLAHDLATGVLRWRSALDRIMAAPPQLERPPTSGADVVAEMIMARF